MLNKLKSRLAVISMVAIVLTLLTQGTLAYYTTVGKTTSVITTGDVRFFIHAMTELGTPFPDEGVYVMPGTVVSKQVSIQSDCNHPFYLRVRIIYGLDEQELPVADCVKLSINEEHWEYHDGWYYYTGIVQPGDTTPIVFSHVEIVGSKVDNSYIGKTLSLTVNAQAVQSQFNPIPEGGHTYEAHGWPAE